MSQTLYRRLMVTMSRLSIQELKTTALYEGVHARGKRHWIDQMIPIHVANYYRTRPYDPVLQSFLQKWETQDMEVVDPVDLT
jgi:hypothetical protein